jgi:hypothetical protein
MADFEDVLSIPVNDIEAPKARPAGTYRGQVIGLPVSREWDSKAGEHFKAFDFKVKLLEPMEDVSQDDLSEQPPINDWPVQTYTQFYHNEGSLFGLKVLLTEGFKLDGDGKTLRQLLAETPGQQAGFHITQEPYKDRNDKPQIRSRIDQVVAL